jgi:outer membrane cobalamin receptor
MPIFGDNTPNRCVKNVVTQNPRLPVKTNGGEGKTSGLFIGGGA